MQEHQGSLPKSYEKQDLVFLIQMSIKDFSAVKGRPFRDAIDHGPMSFVMTKVADTTTKYCSIVNALKFENLSFDRLKADLLYWQNIFPSA